MTQKAPAEKLLVYYPGHLGLEPVTRLRGGMRAVRWELDKVVALPREDALDLIRLQGFREARPASDVLAAYGLEKLPPLALKIKTDGATVVVLDPTTVDALRLAAAEAKRSAEEPPKKPKTTPDQAPAAQE